MKLKSWGSHRAGSCSHILTDAVSGGEREIWGGKWERRRWIGLVGEEGWGLPAAGRVGGLVNPREIWALAVVKES